MAADLAITGAHVRTLDPENPFATAVAVKDGVIVAVGDDATVRAECDATTTLVNGSGISLVPGLVDSHVHHFWGSEELLGAIDLNSATTLDELRGLLAAERDRGGTDGWIIGQGMKHGLFADEGILNTLIEDAVGGMPAMLLFFDHHTMLASREAMKRAGITGPRPLSGSNEVVTMDGIPTGELREWDAMESIKQVAPEATDDQKYRWYVEGLRILNSHGLTGSHGMDGTPGHFDLMRKLEGNGDLSMRMTIPLWQKPDTTREQQEAHLSYRDERGRLWKGGSAKFFIDGVIETGTGWLLEPDVNGQGLDPFWPEPDFYQESVARFAKAGFQCITHALGDHGIRWALDAYEKAGAAPGIRHRIEHCELVDDADVPRFAQLGVVASMQMLHMDGMRADGTDAWQSRVGPERSKRAFRAADLRDAGALVTLGSDWPVAHFDPRINMAWAQLRRPAGEVDRAPLLFNQALTPMQVLEGYTVNPAKTISEDHLSGRIKVGYRADLSGFDQDPVDIDPDQLMGLKTRLTVVDGRVVYQAEA